MAGLWVWKPQVRSSHQDPPHPHLDTWFCGMNSTQGRALCSAKVTSARIGLSNQLSILAKLDQLWQYSTLNLVSLLFSLTLLLPWLLLPWYYTLQQSINSYSFQGAHTKSMGDFSFFFFYILNSFLSTFSLRAQPLGTSLATQWLRLYLPMQGVWIWSLVGELRTHMPKKQEQKHKNKSSVVTNIIKS